MAFELPAGADASKLNEGMQTGNAVQLPFLAPYFYVVNGDMRLRSVGNASYYGGWGVDKDQLIDAADACGEAGPPHGFEEFEITGHGNKAVSVYHSRSILVAPVSMRKSWFMVDQAGSTRRAADYFPGARQHLQVLVFVATKDKNDLRPWGPGVLSAKGWQANYLMDAFSAWKSHIEKARRAAAPDVPAWCFYLSVGTFGDQPNVKEVGKTTKNTVTPITAYLPQTVDTPLLEKLYVGPTVVAEMLRLKDEASDWLNAWGQASKSAAAAPAVPAYDSDGDYPPLPEEPPEDDIPF